MIRSQLCKVANIEPSTFNSHRRNGDLPFKIEDYESQDGTGRVWARFDLFAAAALIAARKLCNQGMSWSDAARVIRTPEVPGPAGVSTAWFRPDIFVSAAVYTVADAGQISAQERVFRGKFESNAARAFSYPERVFHPDQIARLETFVSVNVSAAYREAELRAEELGIEVSPIPRSGGDLE